MNLEALLGLLQGQDLGKLAEQVGGSSTEVRNGVAAALPAILAGGYKKIFFEGDENSVHGDVVEYEHPRDAAECHKLQVFFFPQTGPK